MGSRLGNRSPSLLFSSELSEDVGREYDCEIREAWT